MLVIAAIAFAGAVEFEAVHGATVNLPAAGNLMPGSLLFNS